MPLSDGDVDALLNLLSEPEPGRAKSIVAHVASLPPADVEHLVARAQDAAPSVRRNLAAAQSCVRFALLDTLWSETVNRRRLDLERALVLIAQTAMGDEVDASEVKRRLDELAERVGQKLAGDRAFDNGLNAIAEVLGGEAGLRGNRDVYYDARNSYLPLVLQRGVGIPISLCSVAILVGQRLDLPVHGIGAPGHFLGFYGDPAVPSGSFFDPFDGFCRISRASAEKLVIEQAGSLDPRALAPVNEREIAARTMRNLIALHRQNQEIEIAERLLAWLDMLVNHA